MTRDHQQQPVRTAGSSLDEAEAAVILVHGRGATAQSIMAMADEFDTQKIAYRAPQATENSWYPNSFLAPVDQNEPGRSDGIDTITTIIDDITDAGLACRRILLAGFSQGACLASEYVARHPRQYGGLAALSGGLIGDTIDINDYEGDLAETPVFLGCSDVDPHIPEERVHTTADVLEKLNADVTTRIYEGMGHGIDRDELEYLSNMIAALTTPPTD